MVSHAPVLLITDNTHWPTSELATCKSIVTSNNQQHSKTKQRLIRKNKLNGTYNSISQESIKDKQYSTANKTSTIIKTVHGQLNKSITENKTILKQLKISIPLTT